MRLRPILFTLVLLLAASFAHAAESLKPFSSKDAPPAFDYAKSASWLAQPQNAAQYPVDIFWVYPTILHDNQHWLMDSTPSLREAAANTLRVQASVFSGQANLYAPMYRQMNMQGLALPPKEQEALIKYGMDDVWRAFNYYLKHYNNGRPFILAAHSQGSNVLTNLALKHWGTLGVEKQLVAAYLIGWSITEDDLKANPALAICEEAKQVNCFISYNTMAEGRQKAAPTLKQGSIVVNPLTWTTNGEFAPASLNLGSTFFLDRGKTETLPEFTSAQIKDFGLVVTPKDLSLVESGGSLP